MGSKKTSRKLKIVVVLTDSSSSDSGHSVASPDLLSDSPELSTEPPLPTLQPMASNRHNPHEYARQEALHGGPNLPDPETKNKVAYNVYNGREVGVYSTWAAAKRQVDGFSCASFKGFSTLCNARADWAWVKANNTWGSVGAGYVPSADERRAAEAQLRMEAANRQAVSPPLISSHFSQLSTQTPPQVSNAKGKAIDRSAALRETTSSVPASPWSRGVKTEPLSPPPGKLTAQHKPPPCTKVKHPPPPPCGQNLRAERQPHAPPMVSSSRLAPADDCVSTVTFPEREDFQNPCFLRSDAAPSRCMNDDDLYHIVIRGVVPGVYLGYANAEEAIGYFGKPHYITRGTYDLANELFVQCSMAGEVRWLSPVDGRHQPK